MTYPAPTARAVVTLGDSDSPVTLGTRSKGLGLELALNFCGAG